MSTNDMTTAKLEKTHVEIAKLMVISSKQNREHAWYPTIAVTGLIDAVVAVQ